MGRAGKLVDWLTRDVLRGLAVIVAVAITVGAPAVWLTSGGSESEYAREAVQSHLINPATGERTARVDTCNQIGSDADARIFRCRITAQTCVRSFRFAVMRDHAYGTAPYTVSADAYENPCRFRSD